MHDPLNYVEELARQARRESAPQGDVAARVIQRLHAQPAAWRMPMLVFTAGYGALAVIALIYGLTIVSSAQDPLADVFRIAAGIVS